MNRELRDLDYANVVKRALSVALRPQNLLVLWFGAAVVILAGWASLFLLAGPLGVGYAATCAKLARGQRAELDDIFWRGFERLRPAVVAGVPLMAAAFVGLFILVIPGLLAFMFAALVFCVIAFEPEPIGGLEAIERVWNLASERPAPFVMMGLIASLVGAPIGLTGIGLGVMVGFFFLVAYFVYLHYFGAAASARA